MKWSECILHCGCVLECHLQLCCEAETMANLLQRVGSMALLLVGTWGHSWYHGLVAWIHSQWRTDVKQSNAWWANHPSLRIGVWSASGVLATSCNGLLFYPPPRWVVLILHLGLSRCRGGGNWLFLCDLALFTLIKYSDIFWYMFYGILYL